MSLVQPLTPCIWVDHGQAVAAAEYYVGIFPNSRVTGGADAASDDPGHGISSGDTLVATFELDGQPFQTLAGGPIFTPDEAISFVIHCRDQAEVDRYWEALTADGGQESQCGWLKDRFGVSWQVVPQRYVELATSTEPGVAARVNDAMMQMRKLDVTALEAAARG